VQWNLFGSENADGQRRKTAAKRWKGGKIGVGDWNTALWRQQQFIFDGDAGKTHEHPGPGDNLCVQNLGIHFFVLPSPSVCLSNKSLEEVGNGIGNGNGNGEPTRRGPVPWRGANANLDINKRTRARCYTGRNKLEVIFPEKYTNLFLDL